MGLVVEPFLLRQAGQGDADAVGERPAALDGGVDRLGQVRVRQQQHLLQAVVIADRECQQVLGRCRAEPSQELVRETRW